MRWFSQSRTRLMYPSLAEVCQRPLNQRPIQPQASPAAYVPTRSSTVFSHALVPHEADAPDPVRQVGVHRGRGGDARPGRLLVRVPVLQDAVALRALAGLAVDARGRGRVRSAAASVPQSPSVPCCHQLSTAAWAYTMSSSMPHLQAAHRRIWCVVPVNWPSTRGAITVLARASSPLKKPAPTWWPVVWFAVALAPLFSLYGVARTQVAHWAPDGRAALGGSVAKWAGAGATGLRRGRRRTRGGDAREARSGRPGRWTRWTGCGRHRSGRPGSGRRAGSGPLTTDGPRGQQRAGGDEDEHPGHRRGRPYVSTHVARACLDTRVTLGANRARGSTRRRVAG